MTAFYLVQHAEKQRRGGDPGLTVTGRAQALWTGSCLRDHGVKAVYASPLRRARETAEIIAAVLGLPVRIDARLRERMNWDGQGPLSDFLADWQRSTRDRDYHPAQGDSSRDAGRRVQGFLSEHGTDPGASVLVLHGGVTVDLLRNLYGDRPMADRPALIDRGVPPCAVTTLATDGKGDDLELRGLADDAHLTAPTAPAGAFVHQISGYRPRWLYTAREVLDVHGSRLAGLVDAELRRTWLTWDTDTDEWFAEGPVIFEFDSCRLTVCHRRTGECSLSWDDLDPHEPVDAGDESLRLSWRADPLPVLSTIAGQKLRVLDLIEAGDPDGRWMIEAVELGFLEAHCRLCNTDGQNDLATGPAPAEPRRRVRVS